MNTPAQCGAIKPPKTDIYSEAPHVGLLGVWFGVFGRVGLGVGVWFGLLTLGLCGGVSSGWCRLAGGSGKGSQGAECGVELCCPGPAGGVSQGGCA